MSSTQGSQRLHNSTTTRAYLSNKFSGQWNLSQNIIHDLGEVGSQGVAQALMADTDTAGLPRVRSAQVPVAPRGAAPPAKILLVLLVFKGRLFRSWVLLVWSVMGRAWRQQRDAKVPARAPLLPSPTT